MTAYQRFLFQCSCSRKAVIFRDNIPLCAFCRCPLEKGMFVNYEPEHFPKELFNDGEL